MSFPPLPDSRRWLRPLAAATLALSAVLVAVLGGCGGGDGVGVGGTGGYAQGPIAGFGSVIVNGIRFDDSASDLQVRTEDDGPLDRSALGLGMFAQVESGPIATAANGDRSATARRIVIGRELLGRIEAVLAAIDGSGAELTIVGQRVTITPATVFGAAFAGGVATLAPGQIVEVYGSAGGPSIVATRIDLRTALPPAFVARGIVAAWTRGSGSSGSFRLGAADFAYDGALPAGFELGAYVKVTLDPAPVAGAWRVRSVELGRRAAPDVEDAEFKGTVTAFTSLQSFALDGQPVTTDASTSFPTGQAIAAGSYVEVHGRLGGGVLRATEVKLEDDSGSGGGGYGPGGSLSGLNTTLKTFQLQGQTIDYAQSPSYRGGVEADLSDGDRLRVKARMSNDRTKLVATEIRFE